MAILGVPYKVTYWSKNAKSGLVSITAKVKRPDGTVVGPLILTELVDSGFEGCYTATYNTAVSDPEGSYIFVVSSPNEGQHKAFKTEIFEDKPDIDLSGFDIGVNRKQLLEAEVKQQQRVVADIVEKDIEAVFTSKGKIEATFYKDELEYFLDNNQLEGSF